MTEKSPTAEKLRAIVEDQLPKILEDLIAEKDLTAAQKVNLGAQVNSAIRILRTTMLQLTA